MDDVNGAARARVAEIDNIPRFRDKLGVWLSFAGAAYYQLYREELSPIGLRPSWVTALAIIEQEPGITQSSLGRRLAINRASAMAMATEMEARGLIVRSSPAGRNRIAIHASREGLAKLDEACNIEEELTRRLVGELDPMERDDLLCSARRILRKASNVNDSAQSELTPKNL